MFIMNESNLKNIRHILHLYKLVKSTGNPLPEGFEYLIEKLFPEGEPIPDFEAVREIEKRLRLTFTPEKIEGNVCFINNNEDLRDEFKQTFTLIDLLDAIYFVLQNSSKASELIDSEDSDSFWKLVKEGRKMRETFAF